MIDFTSISVDRRKDGNEMPDGDGSKTKKRVSEIKVEKIQKAKQVDHRITELGVCIVSYICYLRAVGETCIRVGFLKFACPVTESGHTHCNLKV